MIDYVIDFVRVVLVAFVALFPVLNPLGDAPVFLSLTRQYPPVVRKLLARKIAVYGFVLLAVSLVLGSVILAFLGISLVVLQIAGGLVVASTGWKLLNQPDDTPSEKGAPAPVDDALEHAFFPLTFPIAVGPGSISIVITIGAHLRSRAGPGFEHGYPLHFLAALAGICLVCLLVMVSYGNADRLVRIIGKSGTTVLVRLSSFILVAIGIQIIWNGLSIGLPQMLAHSDLR